MLFPSRSFRRIFLCGKAVAELSTRCNLASIRFIQNPIPLIPSRHNCCTTWPLFVVASRFIGNSRSFTTKTSPNEEEVVLNEIFAATATGNALRSTSDICNAYIDKLCRSGSLSAAARFLQSLHDKHVFIGSNAYEALLAAASEKNDIGLVSQVFIDAIGSSESWPPTSYLYIAKAFAKTNDYTRLFRFIKDVVELTFPSLKVLNRIILAFAEYRQIDQALLIFNQIKSLKCKPDLIMYNIILDILGRAGRVDKMLHEFSSMKEAGISPDVVSYNTLLNSLKKVGRVDICAVYFKEMGDNRIQPDLLTYTALIDCFGRSGNVEESLRLFNEMKARQFRPSIYIYRSLVNNLRKMGKLELAMTLLKEMNSCTQSDLAGPKDFKQTEK